MLSHTLPRPRPLCMLLVLALWLAGPAAVHAQPGRADDAASPTPMVVTGDEVYVRTGPGTPFYPFGTVDSGDVVQVIGEKNGWARVLTVGPAFRGFFGYVRYTEGDSSRFRVTQNGTKGMTLGRVELIAPNAQLEMDPIRSWKRLSALPVDTELEITKTEVVDGQTVHTVKLPRGTEGWINMSLLREATPADLQPKRETTAKPAEAQPKSARDQNQNQATPPAKTNEQTAKADGQAAQPRTPAETATDRDAQPEGAAEAETEGDGSNVLATEERELDRPAGAGNEEPTETTEKSLADEGPKSPEERLEALEKAYEFLRKEPIESAELAPLRELYLALAADPESSKGVARYAEARAEQLAIWTDLQESRRKLATLQRRLEQSAEETEAERRALASAGDYIAVGRLATSRIFDGRKMPKLYRLQDAGTGRTVAYIRPTEAWDLPGMLGQLVGVVGEKRYDAGLRLYLIDPSRMDFPPR